jgi:hypothetical protein
MMKPSWPYLLILSLLAASCNDAKKGPTLFELKENTGVQFTNTVTNTPDFNIFSYRNFYNGGGTAIGDINNDGLADIFFSANMGSNKLYLNKGNWQFEDISKKAGIGMDGTWCTGIVMVDINNDGWLDIYVCNAGINKFKEGTGNALFINNHDLTFTESAKAYGLDDNGYTTHAAFFDYDLDGDLDCYILNNSFIPVNTLNYSNKRNLRAKDWPVADFMKGGGDKLLRNDKGHFTDVSEQAGIYGSLIGFGLGVTVGDVNADGYPDIYVSNDFFERDYLYINNHDGTFKEELESRIGHLSHSSMGADMNDINNDGKPDIFVTEMLPRDDYRLKTTTSFENIDVQRLKVNSGFYYQFMQNTLQLNDGNGRFREIAHYGGVAASDWSWGALMFDADNDGYSDIYVCNGIYNDVTDQDFIDFFANDVVQQMVLTGKKEQFDQIIAKMPSRPIPNLAFRNLGNLKFADAGKDWGFEKPSFSNGAAYGDLDNDGDLDLIVNNVNQPAFIYRNNSREQHPENHYIGFKLKGTPGNTFAVGSTVSAYVNGQILDRQLIPSRGFQSSIDYKIILGLGKATRVDSVVVTWPDMSYSTFQRPPIDTVLLYTQPEKSGPRKNWSKPTFAPLFTLADTTSFLKHEEDDFIDFYDERNVPQMTSKEGPKIARGDVNGDGLEDVYIGGAGNQGGHLYLQTPKGFVLSDQLAFRQSVEFEDVATLFFDADRDGDLDLFVGSGGNNKQPGLRGMLNRLYINDGKGNFSFADNGALPKNMGNTSVAVANDFDHDGDLDLFVGTRNVPMNYGLDPENYIYLNDGKGHFRDIAPKTPAFKTLGMVTGASWVDIDGDKKEELVVVGDWMAPKVFSYAGNESFQERQTGMETWNGWWQTIASADLDGDGDQDLVLGNIGENYYLQPDKAHPVKMWINDFDQNQNVEKLITRRIGDRDMPVFLKKELTDQIPSLKKQNLKYEDYAKRSVQELFDPILLEKSQVKQVTMPSTVVAWNDGKGHFQFKALPVSAQLSAVTSVAITDLDGDDRPDLILAGNLYDFQPQFSRLDANDGVVYLNKGSQQWAELDNAHSGLSLRGMVRDLAVLGKADRRWLLVGRNSAKPMLYALNPVAKK